MMALLIVCLLRSGRCFYSFLGAAVSIPFNRHSDVTTWFLRPWRRRAGGGGGVWIHNSELCSFASLGCPPFGFTSCGRFQGESVRYPCAPATELSPPCNVCGRQHWSCPPRRIPAGCWPCSVQRRLVECLAPTTLRCARQAGLVAWSRRPSIVRGHETRQGGLIHRRSPPTFSRLCTASTAVRLRGCLCFDGTVPNLNKGGTVSDCSQRAAVPCTGTLCATAAAALRRRPSCLRVSVASATKREFTLPLDCVRVLQCPSGRARSRDFPRGTLGHVTAAPCWEYH